MRRVTVFNLVSLDGRFAGPRGDLSWFGLDAEFQPLAEANANSGNTLLFGRVTYQHMANWWPTAEALRTNPVVARGMNKAKKIVFSRTLREAAWSNTRLVKGDLLDEVRALKRGRGKDLTILGSGSIVSQLAQAGLVDEYQLLFNPVILGRGKGLFDGLKERIALRLTKSRIFGNGNVLLHCEPVR